MMTFTTDDVLQYILKRQRSVLALSVRFSNEKKLRRTLKELHHTGKIKYGRLPHKDKGMYLHVYVPEMPPEGIEIVGTMEKRHFSARENVLNLLIGWENILLADKKQADVAADVCDKIFQAIEDSTGD